MLVLGEDREATDLVQALADRIPGMRGIYAGRLRNAHQVEAFTANLISVNRRYKAHAGLRVTDVLTGVHGAQRVLGRARRAAGASGRSARAPGTCRA